MQMTVYANGVSVLMPGDNIPTFIAHPVPVPHPSQHISKSQHQHSSSRDSSNSNFIQEYVFRSVIVFSPLNSLSFAYMTLYANGVSVLMPGGNIPTFIAHPVPVPHPSQHISKSQHQHSSSRDSSNSNSIQEC
ncbi:hypothetical protein F2Q68_00040635 [Brassica cretica]|uniref:Uncharacterized protein n=1 Tax=Brassica cretica TaxID=69181 RepID=A0A8S9ME30_BRACR|nr:hypothetical protein F2Q68_00040635 [Brassica cretica]